MLTTNTIAAIVAAIYVTEGGQRADVPYGIHSVKVHSKEEARRVCYNTVHHAAFDYHASTISTNFLIFLSNRYCPPSCDPKGNKNWQHNMIMILKPKQ